MLGQAVAAAANAAGHDAVALNHGALEITDAAACEAAIVAANPSALINCAAWTDVDGAEAAEAAATAINGGGAANLAAACAANGVRMIQLSTDYVFDGSTSGPYLESAPVAPQSAYGRSKLAGEEATVAAGGDYAIVRTAWLFGYGGTNFVDTILALARERASIAVVTDQIGSPTWTGHLAAALVALAEATSQGIFHIAGSGSCSWFELASAALEAAGSECEVTAVTSEAFPRAAKRPANSVLASERGAEAIVLPDWRVGLAGHLLATGVIDSSASAAAGAQ
jgi:dTDP-4-dehydrorhamnose reductase